jgi:hypothetical protein
LKSPPPGHEGSRHDDDYRIPSRRGWRCHVDWIVLTAALTGLGLWLMTNLGGGTLNTHTQNIRGELQDPHFDTEWFDYVAVLPPSME